MTLKRLLNWRRDAWYGGDQSYWYLRIREVDASVDPSWAGIKCDALFIGAFIWLALVLWLAS